MAASLVSTASICTAGPVSAQPSASNNQTLAEVLFREGQKLFEKGKYAEACPKFAESQRLDPGTGTLINLALCHEKEGKAASAWTEFRQAAGEARTAGRRERVKLAEDHIAALEPQLSKVVIQLAPEVAQLNPEVHFDNVVLGRAAWGVAMPADPGTHQIRVSAPGKSWKSTVDVATRAAPVTVTVSALQDEGATPTTQAAIAPAGPTPRANTSVSPHVNPGDTASGGGSAAKTIVLVVEGAVVVGGLVLGAVYLGKASSAQSDADTLRTRLAGSDPNPCRPGGAGSSTDCTALRTEVDANSSASKVATAAFVASGVGAVALAATWLFWKPSSSPSEVSVAPILSAGAGGVVLTWSHR